MKMTDVRAVITGGASGLGNAVARHLIAQGGRVALLDLQDGPGAQAVKELGAQAHYFNCDVTSEAAVNAAMAQAAAAMGAINLLVNCAGITGSARTLGKSGPMPGELYTKVIHVNLIGTFLCDKAAAALMQQNPPNAEGERGVIVHTSSVAAFEGQIGQAAYSATKAGVVGMTLPLAREFAALRHSGAVDCTGHFPHPDVGGPAPGSSGFARPAGSVPGTARTPEEFARLVQAICEITMLNGETIRLDGAIRMQPK